MARASNVVALLAVAGLALIGSTEALLPGLTEGVPEECQPFIENLVSNCTIELLDVATKFEIPFPVPEDFMAPNITEEQVTNYTDTMPPVSEMCCTNMCLTANSGCGCDNDTIAVLTDLLQDTEGRLITGVFNYIGETCGFTPSITFVPESCDPLPENMC
eukprot:evm.model.scf_400.2 EVM.evm.TU.scf_400.2   scf_400:58354-62295(+)